MSHCNGHDTTGPPQKIHIQENTTYIEKHPWHLTSIKYEFGDSTRRLSLWLRFSNSAVGCNKSTSQERTCNIYCNNILVCDTTSVPSSSQRGLCQSFYENRQWHSTAAPSTTLMTVQLVCDLGISEDVDIQSIYFKYEGAYPVANHPIRREASCGCSIPAPGLVLTNWIFYAPLWYFL